MLLRRYANIRQGVWKQTCRRRYSQGVTVRGGLRDQKDEAPAVYQPCPPAKPKLKISLLSAERKTRTRHLLRSILRECTYLPDSWARIWTIKHALGRFREYGFRTWEHRFDPEYEERLRRKEREARSLLALLRRANEGERDCLLRILLMTYGRLGKRRHELMLPLLPVKGQLDLSTKLVNEEEEVLPQDLEDTLVTTNDDPDSVPDEQSPTYDPFVKAPATAPYIPQTFTLDLPPPLRALLLSQIKTAPPDLIRPNPRRLNPIIPELNSFGRAMPQKRIKNMKQKHYADLLDRLHPPLPLDEWERLRGLVSGETRTEDVPARRTAVSCTATSTSPAISGDGSTGVKSALDLVVVYGKAPKKIFEHFNGHAITPRFMQRLYAEVFALCPKMEYEAEEQKWKITWGKGALSASGRRARMAQGRDDVAT